MTPAEPTHLALGEALRFPAGPDEDVVVEPIGGRVHVLSAEQRRVLAVLRGEGTLDEHAALAARRLGSRPEVTRALVEALAMKGFLIERAELHERLHAAARPPRARPEIATLGIPTRGRSAALIDCVREHAAAALARGRRLIAVVADSSEGDAAEAARAALGALGRDGVEIRHAGLAERERFAPRLAAAAGVDPAVVARALLGDPRIGIDTGANRNTLLLDGAGEPLVMLDDDVRPRFVRAPDGEEIRAGEPLGRGLALWSGEPYSACFAEPDEPLVPEDAWATLDPFSLHEALLGADVARAIVEPRPGGVDPSCAAAGFFQKLVRGGGRVAITQLGCAGDHGMGASTPLLLARGPTRARLLASEARFEDAMTRRRILRYAPVAAIGDTDFCMSMHLGIDARDLVPPFPFAGRDADGVFGAVLRACARDAFVGFPPWAAWHRASARHEPARAASLDREIAAAGRSGPNDLLRVAIGAIFEPRGASTASELVSLGSALERLAARPRDADGLLREHAARALGGTLVRIERLLDEHGHAPDRWARALAGVASAVRASLTGPAVHLPADLVDAHGVPAARDLFLEHIAGVGRLLAAWPAMFEAARELRERGERPSAPLSGGGASPPATKT